MKNISTDPEVPIFFLFSTQLSMEFQLLITTKMLKLSDVVLIKLNYVAI